MRASYALITPTTGRQVVREDSLASNIAWAMRESEKTLEPIKIFVARAGEKRAKLVLKCSGGQLLRLDGDITESVKGLRRHCG